MRTESTTRSLGAHEATQTYPWADWTDEKLLETRICELRLHMQGSAVEPLIDNLYQELSDHGIAFHPRCYLTTEWLCPDRVPLIGIPFCLAHPRLFALEKKMMLEVEGGTERSFMMLIRHEMGHAINYAYRLYARSRWRDLFGPISQEYDVQEYYPRPYSREFVEHLPDNYAQSHPDEDFAETFAVWLSPHIDWRTKYRGRKALKKLEYVDHLMSTVSERPALVGGGEKLWPVHRLRSTLRTYYQRKQRDFGDGYPGYYDPQLHLLFTADPDPNVPRAGTFLRQNRRHLTNLIAKWGRFRKYEVDQILTKMIARAKELDLRLSHDEATTTSQLCICLTAMLSDFRARRNELDDLYRTPP